MKKIHFLKLKIIETLLVKIVSYTLLNKIININFFSLQRFDVDNPGLLMRLQMQGLKATSGLGHLLPVTGNNLYVSACPLIDIS